METSDSEYFESADEDFYSDNEVNKKQSQLNSKHKVIDVEHDLNNLSLHEAEKPINITDINKNENTKVQDKVESEVLKHDYLDKQNDQIQLCDKVNTTNENNRISVDLIKESKISEYTCESIKDNIINNTSKEELSSINPLISSSSEPKLFNKHISKPNLSSKLDSKLETTTKDVHRNETRTDFTVTKTDDSLWNDSDGWEIDEEIENVNDTLTGSDIKVTDNFTKAESATEDLLKDSLENMWDNDDWEPFDNESIETKSEVSDSNNSNLNTNAWSGWGNWGVSSILTTATQSVSTLTNQVSQGLTTVLESSIGIPNPEELAKLNYDDKQKLEKTYVHQHSEELLNKNLLNFGFSNIVSGVSNLSKLVENTGTKVISGGLDTLEIIGKKTMDVLQEGDPGLKKKRSFLKLDHEKPILSQVLREAKEKAEQENKALQERQYVKKMNYETLFDDHQGLVHLEALEMLSKQCDIKLQTLSNICTGDALTEMQETLDQIKELCELPNEDDEEQISSEEIKERLKSAVNDININITYNKLISVWEEAEAWLDNLNVSFCDEGELHQQAIETLAQLTAIAVEQFHKAGELLLIKEHHSTADEADSLVQLSTTLALVIGVVATKFSDQLNKNVSGSSDKDKVSSLITNIFYEAANSNLYIRNAFQLLVPVLQVGAV